MTTESSETIIVGDSVEFPSSKWREAILYFLDSLESLRSRNTDDVVTPRIEFDKFVLRWDMVSGTFVAWRKNVEQMSNIPWQDGPILEVKCHDYLVEESLKIFANDDDIKALSIYLPYGGVVIFGKTEESSELVTWSMNLPHVEDLWGVNFLIT